MLDDKLHLTDAQKQQITGIWVDAEQKGKALRDDDSLSKDDRRAKMGEIMKASHAQVRAVLHSWSSRRRSTPCRRPKCAATAGRRRVTTLRRRRRSNNLHHLSGLVCRRGRGAAAAFLCRRGTGIPTRDSES